ncbi:mitotic spindle assembly checkpoint protein-like protein MAD1 [Patellaria atrata CBS 101060]|uniref:Spindle assembly checkpoint component MAD1 n=1 Tax=Patellaria atrata CBS 101060 TaxID=1346257 RepID=A0A9P4SBE1_9PEZI|nr:mitotic spindle assembly checkpoint protein-like protein MAD1 [Patellaria atrata CBS 101060]
MHRYQPTYDFLSGAPSPPPQQQVPFRETLRQSQISRPDPGNEDLRAQINTLQYELDSLKQERELTALRYQKELRDAQAKADADFKRAQQAESSNQSATNKYDNLVRELQDTKDRAANERAELERRFRAVKDENTNLQEELDESKGELASLERQSNHRLKEVEIRHNTLKTTLEELQADVEAKVTALQTTQKQLSQKVADVDQLESEVLRLKAQTGDPETVAVIKRELSEQVTHIRKLEATNREQLAELKQYRKIHKSIDVVEEEKRVLEGKLRMMDDLRRELSEAHLKRQILEDERKSWTAYLESESSGEGELQFESPEDMARAFINERLERAALLDKLGAIQPELAVKEENIKALESEKEKLLEELEKTRASVGGGDSKMRLRLERQRTLAVKEVEYLRAQLQNFDAEESELQPDKYDEQKSKRIKDLESLVDEYRNELQTLQSDLKAQEMQLPLIGTKRARDDDDDERIGELRRKNRDLQDRVEKQKTAAAVLEADLKATKAQLSSLKASSRTRILTLRSNPTADVEAIKLSTLKTLREENNALLAQLQHRKEGYETVPKVTFEARKLEIEKLHHSVAEKEKRMLRLKQIWSAKSAEFREAVASILGWKMDFMPNGRVRLTNLFNPGNEEEGEQNSIIFDGEKGEMKVSGGRQSAFAQEIREMVEFWVDGRKEIPCFMAAMTLEFYDKYTRVK